MKPLTRGGPRRWPEILNTEANIGRDQGPFAVDVLTVPDVNPWLCEMRLSGFDFLPDGRRAAVCTWDGDVWMVDGIDQPANGLRWQRIASGLFQPLGLKIVSGRIFVSCRDQIVCLHDYNGDGETDFYENFNSDHQVTEHFHEFAMGLQTDNEGNFYYAKAARHGLPALVPQHGTLLKVSKDGVRTEIIATGFRAPNGVCLNRDGTFFLSDQEGFWTPKNRINWVKRGGFYGNMWGYHDVTDASDLAMEPPVCWITNAMDRSPAELLWVESTNLAWNPLVGSLLCLSYGNGKIFLVPHEIAGDKMQGGVCALANSRASDRRDARAVSPVGRPPVRVRPVCVGRRPDAAGRILSGARDRQANVLADRHRGPAKRAGDHIQRPVGPQRRCSGVPLRSEDLVPETDGGLRLSSLQRADARRGGRRAL